MRVLVINCGSATLKYKLFEDGATELATLAGATVEITGGYQAAVEEGIAALPVLREVSPLAPLHNGPALEGIEATLAAGVPLVAALDSAFHAGLPPRAW